MYLDIELKRVKKVFQQQETVHALNLLLNI